MRPLPRRIASLAAGLGIVLGATLIIAAAVLWRSLEAE